MQALVCAPLPVLKILGGHSQGTNSVVYIGALAMQVRGMNTRLAN